MKIRPFKTAAGYIALLVSVLPLGVLEAAPAPEALFSQANEAYSREEYTDAIDLYRQCLAEAQSGALHYNLGNAYYQTGEIGPAVLHYEKALALRPNNPDAHANLHFLRATSQLPEPETGLAHRWAQALPLNIWCWLAAAGFWGSAALVLLPRMFDTVNVFTRLLLFFSLLLMLSGAAALYGYKDKSSQSVVLQSDTPLRVAPANESPPTAYMQAGELAVIVKEREDFYFVNTQTGKSGWVLHAEIGKIWD